jgi:hypothetical protein
MLASDDPDELAEQADAVRDEQDRLRKELARLDRRIGELANERRLDLQMRDFITDQEIFDEGSRLMVVPRSSAITGGPPSGQNGDPGRSDEPGDGIADDADVGGLYDGAEGPASGADPSPKTDLTPSVAGSSTAAGRIPVGVRAGESIDPSETGDDLRSIRQRRNAIAKQLKDLQVIGDRLQEKLDALSRE